MTSLCVSPDGKLLLSAGQVIKMWDLDTKEVYRVSFLFKQLINIHVCRFIRPRSTVLRRHVNQSNMTQLSYSLSLLFSLQKFTGHSTAVTTLRFATTRPPDGNGHYFLSGAAHDRLLSVW